MAERGLSRPRFDAAWREPFATLNGLNRILLRAPP